jgi:hypothetical protein
MTQTIQRIPIKPLGISLSLFLIISYCLCVLWGLLAPGPALHHELFELLPGFVWITWPSFFVGMAWSVATAWYIALVFSPLYNYFARSLR